MIDNLYIKDFVLIDELNIDFNNGLSTFTGETGAGKSLIVDAIELLMGKRANGDFIRKGKEQCTIEATITLKNMNNVKALELEDIIEDEQVIVTRTIKENGKSNIKINRRSVTNSDIQKLLGHEINISAQKSQDVLADESNHLNFVDAFGNLNEQKSTYQDLYNEYKLINNKLTDLKNKQFNASHIEFIESQIQEIDDLKINQTAYDDLQEQVKRMEVLAKDMEKIQNIKLLLDDLAIGGIYDISKEMDKIDDDFFQNQSSKLKDIYYDLDGINEEMNNYINSVEFDEQVYNDLQKQIFNINRVIHKYGSKFSDMIDAYNDMQEEVNLYNNSNDILNEWQEKNDKAYQKALSMAEKLSKNRHNVAKELEKQFNYEIQDLYLENADLKVAIKQCDMNCNGIDDIKFLISMNKNQEYSSISKSASGGELNRLMLAMISVLAGLDNCSTLIFDEIDSGVSGNVAFKIGEKMHNLAKKYQVFNITHLAPVACFADNHYFVSKNDTSDETLSQVKLLNELEIVDELANITSGSVDEKSREVAKSLIERAKEV